MMNNICVSVVIPTFNHENFVIQAIQSVFDQTYKNYELIVVDDGSTDNTKDRVSSLFDGRLKYIYQANKGLSAARNTGIKYSGYEYVAFLDADDKWLPNKLELQVARMNQDPGIGLLGCGYYVINEKGVIEMEVPGSPVKDQNKFKKSLFIRNIVSGSGSGVLIRREVLSKVGFFDETLTASEDWDMWLRIAGYYKIDILEEVLVKIMHRSNSMSAPVNAAKMLSNALKILEKNLKSGYGNKFINIKKTAYSDRYYRAAEAFYLLGEKKEARQLVTKSFLLDPFSFLFLFQKAQLLAKLGLSEEFVIFLRRFFNAFKNRRP
ncbi:MAG: glycosyltransferase family 2 protein [Prolixibacteraceae bacterium]|nr:glycosyltransferase family 2 protein [Prolixibacteraceae bacterium]